MWRSGFLGVVFLLLYCCCMATGYQIYARTPLHGAPIYYRVPGKTPKHRRTLETTISMVNFQVNIYLQSDWDFNQIKTDVNNTIVSLATRWPTCLGINVSRIPELRIDRFDLHVTNYCPDLLDASATLTGGQTHVIHFYPNCKADNYIGFAKVGGTNTWILDHYYNSPELVAHELGHNFGLLHTAKNDVEYGDQTSTMSGCCYTVCYNPPHLQTLHWDNNFTKVESTGVWSVPLSGRVFQMDETYFFAAIGNKMHIYRRVTMPGTFIDTQLIDTLTSGYGIASFNGYDVRYGRENNAYALFVAPAGTYPQTRDQQLLYLVPLFLFLGIAPFLVLVA